MSRSPNSYLWLLILLITSSAGFAGEADLVIPPLNKVNFKFLGRVIPGMMLLWCLIAACMTYYFMGLQHEGIGKMCVILICSILGILGSYGVGWFGIRINTVANSRAAFSALRGNPLETLVIPLRSGMSVGLLLVSVELFFMISILAILDLDLIGPCFIGFAIGESLGHP